MIFICFILYSCGDSKKAPHLINSIYTDPTSPGYLFENTLSGKIGIPNIKRIAQYYGDTVLHVLEFDRKGRIIFKYEKFYMNEYWNGRYVTYINANLYNNDKILKTYSLYSNFGFHIIEYSDHDFYGQPTAAKVMEYNSVEEDILTTDDTVVLVGSSLVNSNVHRDIDTVTTFSQLTKLPKIIEMEQDKKIAFNITRQFSHASNKAIDIHNYTNSSKEGFNFEMKFDKKGNLVQRQNVFFVYDKKSRKVKEYFVNGNDTTVVSLCRYGDYEKPDTILAGEWKYVYQYKNGLLISESIYKGGTAFGSTLYKYNQYGLVIEEITKERNKLLTKTYSYKLAFY